MDRLLQLSNWIEIDFKGPEATCLLVHALGIIGRSSSCPTCTLCLMTAMWSATRLGKIQLTQL
ncbi:unnamed protein product [Coffea canephora]|uniref:DH200=94 genomic scaffold, scaffold_371 n=1 Tax=Coffea canephora TaxID=49390 RepID=A0A068VHS3_COFCA|nr:unnamed protein product [Coffea canephora]